MRWSKDFAITGILEYVPFIKEYKSGRRKAVFTLVHRFKQRKPKVFYIHTRDEKIIDGLLKIKRKSLIKATGEIYTSRGYTFLLAKSVLLIRVGYEKLEVYNGNKNDSNESVAGQGVSQDKVN